MKLAVFALLAGCYLSQLPVTPAIVRASSFRVASQSPRDENSYGLAWAIDDDHLITAGVLCVGAENVAILVDGGVVPVRARAGDNDRLCMLERPPHVTLGPPLVLARMWHQRVQHEAVIGSPTWSPLGAVGVVLAMDTTGAVTVSAGRAELEAFARAMGARPAIAPPLEDLDMDLSCPPEARARGGCTP